MHDDHYSHQYQLQFRLRKIPVCSVLDESKKLAGAAGEKQRGSFSSCFPITNCSGRFAHKGNDFFQKEFLRKSKANYSTVSIETSTFLLKSLKEVHPLIFII